MSNYALCPVRCPECGGRYVETQCGRSEEHSKDCRWFNSYGRPDDPLPANLESASEIACAVADAWARADLAGRLILHAFPELCDELDRLEAATAGRSMRKVRRQG